MKKLIIFVGMLSFFAVCQAQNEYWTDRYNVEWNTPSNKVEGNMPLGAGDMACNVWVENGDLLFYIQRSGSFNEIGEHIKMGRVRLTLSPNPFKDYASFSQKLILKDGYIAFKAKGKNPENRFDVRINMWVDQFTHSVNLDVDADKPVAYKVAYESWRTEDKSLKESEVCKSTGKIGSSPRFGSFSFVIAPFEVIKLKDEIRFKDDKVLFYHHNPKETMSPNFGIEQQGLTKYKDQLPNVIQYRTIGGMVFADGLKQVGTGSGKYFSTNFTSYILETEKPAKHHHIYVATHIAQKEDIAEWEKELNKSCSEMIKTGGSFEQNKAWWNAFWERSWIVISPEQKDETSPLWQMGRNYNLVRYMFGGNAYGEYPTKFNGGNLTYDDKPGFDPDWRRWGGDFFTAQNQRLIYWPMLKSGDFDVMAPQFNFYLSGLKGAMIRVKEDFGHEGAMFSENTDATGLHIPFCYGWKDKGNKYERGPDIPFCDSQVLPFIGAGKPVEKGIMPEPSVAYYYHSQLEFAFMMMEYHRYTGMSIEKYMPMIKQTLIFYDQHYQLRQKIRNGNPLDENGKLVIYPSQSLESYKNVKNPVEVSAALHTCLQTLLAMNEPYVTDVDKKYYREYLSRVPELPFGEINGKRVMRPAEVYHSSGAKEAPQFYPLFPYNMYSMLDDEIQTFRNTWKLDTTIRHSFIGWQQDGIFMARMGLIDDAVDFHCKKLGDNENKRRFPTYWGPGYDGIPDHNQGGSGMIGLQEMLMQTYGKKILVLPCWPKDVDVDFKLHAPYNTTVEVSFRKGKIEKLIVSPKESEKDIVLTH